MIYGVACVEVQPLARRGSGYFQNDFDLQISLGAFEPATIAYQTKRKEFAGTLLHLLLE